MSRPTSRLVATLVAAFALGLAATPSAVGVPAGTVTELSLATGSDPYAIVAGPDGNMWFTDRSGYIGRITPAGTVTEFSAGISSIGPRGIAAGPDGNLWYAEGRDGIGRITPTGTVTDFPLAQGSDPYAIAAGPDGNLWFTELDGNRIGRITPTGTVTLFSAGISAGSRPYDIVTGPDGNLWFTELRGDRIGRITPTGSVTEFPVTPGSKPYGITLGADGNLWYAQRATDSIGRMTPTGVVTDFSAGITPGAVPLDIEAGPDGNLWFTEFDGDRVGRITLDGTVTEFPVVTHDSQPYGIAAGPDGDLWFTERTGSKIGRITPPPVRATTTTVTCSPASVAIGVATTCTATVSDTDTGTSSTPTGTVSFTHTGAGDLSASSCTLSAGSCSVDFTPSAVGSGDHEIAGDYEGSATHATSDGVDDVAVGVRGSVTTVACNPAMTTVGVATTCTVTVADDGTGSPIEPTGDVDLAHTGTGDLDAASCTLSAGECSVEYTPAAIDDVPHAVTATYQGSLDHAGSEGDDDVTANGRTTATTVACAPAALVAPATTTCTVTVGDDDAGTASTPIGQVALDSTGPGALAAGTCTLSGGACSIVYSATEPGAHAVAATYGGDPAHAAGARVSTAITASAPPPPSPPFVAIPPPPFVAVPPPPAPPTIITGLTSDVTCLGTAPRARKDITVRYTTSQTATTTFTLERRTAPAPPGRTRCPAKLPAGNGVTTKGSEPLVYVTATAASRATTRAAARAATSPRPLVLTRTEAAGAHTLKLLRAFKVTSLTPGRYRLRIAPVATNGAQASASALYLWVLTPPKATRRATVPPR